MDQAIVTRATLWAGFFVVAGACGGTIENGGSGVGGAPQTSSGATSSTSSSGSGNPGASSATGSTTGTGSGSATATGTSGGTVTGASTTSSGASGTSMTTGGGGSTGAGGGGGNGGSSGAGGGSAGRSAGTGGAGARDAGAMGGGTGIDAGRGGSGGSPADVEQLCVDTINMYRATLGLAPYARWTAEETCGDGQAESDSQTGTAHGAFGKCTESAQNECPGWPAPPEKMITGCLQAMWNEGPGADFATHGHYINMSSTRYKQVACGFATTAAGKIWSVQDFK